MAAVNNISGLSAVRSFDEQEASNDRSQSAPSLSIRGLTKRYGNHVALKPIDLDFYPGQIHVLFGENGAGKSTLISMLAGANIPSGGTISIGSFKGQFASVNQGRQAGVRAVFQEFSLA